MRKQIPAVLLAVVCVVLAMGLYRTKQANSHLGKELAESEEIAASPEESMPNPEAVAEASLGVTDRTVAAAVEAETPEPEPEELKDNSNRPMIRNMAEMMEENPTINKMVEASQRGVVGALYSDMIEYLNLNPEEAKYFMDLLTYRQMAHVGVHMKMMSGDLTEEEKQSLMEEVKLASEFTREEMEKFLNDPEDFEEFDFYEDTIYERMLLSQMDQKLGEAALSEEVYRKVLEIMHDERMNFDFSTDLHDSENRDLSPARFSLENIDKHKNDLKILGDMEEKHLQDILTPEQLAAWREGAEAIVQLLVGQLHQTNQSIDPTR
jgi:hypothetical protein